MNDNNGFTGPIISNFSTAPTAPQQKEIPMTTTGRTNNTHTHGEIYRLTRWIEMNQAAMVGKTQEQIAQATSEANGLKVTASNVRGIAETLGISLGLHSQSTSRIPNDTNRVLARAVCDLYKRLGQEVPTALFLIANR